MANLTPDLMTGFKHGDKQAFRAVYEAYYSRLNNFACQLVENKVEAEDIVAGTFIKLWDRHSKFDTEQNIKAFLYITARNTCFNYLRDRRRKAESQQEIRYLSPTGEDITQQEMTIELMELTQNAIEKLPVQQKAIIKLLYFDGLTVDDVAQRCGISPKTVRNLKSTALNYLREIFFRTTD
jgi:RNA polymerase sigma-70 factor (ECF subfamily)